MSERLWQADFSEFETDGQGVWNLGGVVDYWAKVALACPVTVTKTTVEAIGFFETALAQVEGSRISPIRSLARSAN